MLFVSELLDDGVLIASVIMAVRSQMATAVLLKVFSLLHCDAVIGWAVRDIWRNYVPSKHRELLAQRHGQCRMVLKLWHRHRYVGS